MIQNQTDCRTRPHMPARRTRMGVTLIAIVLMLTLAACGRSRATPTPTPVPTATPLSTATPVPADSAPGAAGQAQPQATPVVTIPDGYSVRSDTRLGYSFALPRGWTDIDLRSPRFSSMADSIGMGEQLGPVLGFLDSPQGQAIGLVAMTDIAGMVFGGIPTLANVAVVDAPGAGPEDVARLVEQLVAGNSALFGDVTVAAPTVSTVNNLPAVQTTGSGSLAAVGMDARVFAKITALLANERVYILTLVTDEGNRDAKEAEFDQIIGTFRPE